MRYNEKFQKYLDGELNLEESAQIEDDLDKMQVLLEYVDNRMDQELYEEELENKEPDNVEKELGSQISRAVSRKLRRYAVVTGAVVLILGLILIKTLSPLMDRIFYSPEDQLDLSMSVYMELFCGDKGLTSMKVRPEGYGRYSLGLETQVNGQITQHSLMLDKSRLSWTDMNWNQPDVPGNAFTYCVEDRDIYCGMESQQAEELIKDLPDTTVIRGAVSFKDVMNLKELTAFMSKYPVEYMYVPMVIYEDQKGHMYQYWGFRPDSAGYVRTDAYDQDEYPYLDLAQYKGDGIIPADILQKHVESMLSYLKDQERFGKIFDTYLADARIFDSLKYDEALRYVREHGVQGYGIVVNARKEDFTELLRDEAVDGVYMLDSHVNLQFVKE